MITDVAKVGRIYLVRLNGEPKYVGFTTQGIEKRWEEHCWKAKNNGINVIHAGIRKYGKDAFTTEVLYQSADLEHTLNIKENQFIMEHKTHVSEGGYNLTMGGEGMIGASDETRRKISKAGKGNRNAVGYIHSEEAKQKMSDAKRGKSSGRVCSKECKQKISEAKKGKYPSEETKYKMSIASKGKAKSSEHRRNVSLANLGKVLSVEHCRKISESHKGKWHSEEVKLKISESLKKRAALRRLTIIHNP